MLKSLIYKNNNKVSQKGHKLVVFCFNYRFWTIVKEEQFIRCLSYKITILNAVFDARTIVLNSIFLSY